MPAFNRRNHTRLDFVTNVVLLWKDREIKGESFNISQGGLFVICEPLSLGEKVTLHFKLPDLDEPIQTEAIVRWNMRETLVGCGFQFVGLRPIEVWGINQIFRRAEAQKR